MKFTLFRLNDNENKNNKKWLIAIYTEHEYAGLLDELLDLITMPKIIKSLGLIRF